MKTIVAFANTAGGVIVIGREDNRERYFPDARVSCALFAGTDKVNFLDRVDVEGGVFQALREVPKFVRRNSRLAAQIESIRRRDIPAYSEIALREVLINAIAHADYSLSGMRIMIAIFSDRLEVQSPGLMPFGMTIDTFKAGTSMVRNHCIAKVLHRLSLMEEWGSGYRRVTAACKREGYPVPEWVEIGPVIRVIFPPHPLTAIGSDVPVNVPVNKRQQWFLEQLQQGVRCNAASIADAWAVAEKTAKRDIRGLRDKGLILFEGAPKTGRYRLVS